MHFAKLRISGFKSFVDPVEIIIEPGLTGIVGPNGCGKSNIIDALRWTMGESSARRMRGAEMDDVIFAGSGGRPARNVAEVAIKLDNSGRRAPAPFDAYAEIEVSRRIDRASGSTYRVNGREARARDVQLLFADFASGAQSAAMVTQGRIGALVEGRPSERRSFLEEAAGITGLDQRRTEAERRIAATRDNLGRLDDLTKGLASQANALRRQAKQAEKYRKLSEQIRAAERSVLRTRWLAAKAASDAAASALAAAGRQVVDLAREAEQADRGRALANHALPPLRQAQQAALATARDLAERERTYRTELAQVETALADHRRQLDQLTGDQAREQRALDEAQRAAARAATEQERLGKDEAAATALLAAAEQALATADAAQQTAEAAVQHSAAALGQEEVRRAAETARHAAERARHLALAERRRKLAAGLEEVRRDLQRVDREAVPAEALPDAERARSAAEAQAARLEAEQAALGPALKAAEAAEVAARRQAEASAARLTAIDAEIRALEPLAEPRTREPAALLGAIRVAAGFEDALAAALGDGLDASLDPAASRAWRALPPPSSVAALPEEARSLADETTAPPALARRLAGIGVAADLAAALALQPALAPGQELVTPDGALVRWDGFVARPGGRKTAAAVALTQINRLTELRRLRIAAVEARDQDGAAQVAARAHAENTRLREKDLRQAITVAAASVRQAAAAEAQLARRAAESGARQAAARERVARLDNDLAELDKEAAQLPPLAEAPNDSTLLTLRQAVEHARADLALTRAALAKARDRRDQLRQDAAARQARAQSLAAEAVAWSGRAKAAGQHLATLAARHAAREADRAALEPRPVELQVAIDDIGRKLALAEAATQSCTTLLTQAESDAARFAAAAETATAAAGAARERRARAEAEAHHASESSADIADEIDRRLDISPESLVAEAGIAEDDIAAALARFERLTRERDGLGAVNLAAERDLVEIEAQIGTLAGERGDVDAALEKLQQGVQALNREARTRLMAAFETINGHFGRLFARLFDGGHATLALTESPDPLAAGLEIMASPPGKRLQTLSLLSGGERALTALALLFALFLTNPAPICVLDEVDAPLDDANVDRFCRLVEEIGRETGTRFLVVTHHRVTMARMHRLYGVTMVENGVSRLVSVDLVGAEALRQSA